MAVAVERRECLGEKATDLRSAIGAIAAFVRDFEPRCFTGEDAKRLSELFAEGEKLCATGKAMAATRVVDTSTWSDGLARSPEDWLAKISGTGIGPARAAIDTADRLERQPELSDALRSGDLSMSQAAEISAAAAGSTDPEAAKKLIERSRGRSFRTLQDECRTVAAQKTRSAEEDRARAEALRRRRFLRTWTDGDGSGRINGRFAPDDFARLLACMKPYQERVFKAARKEGKRETFEAYASDALVAMADAATGAEPDAPGRKVVPSTVIVLVDHAALIRGHVEGEELCEIAGVGAVPVSVVEQMLGDAFLAVVVKDGTDIRSVAHGGRKAIAKQRTALAVRERGRCVSCSSTYRLEIDHVDEWNATHKTVLDRLAPLCHHCHFLKTHRGWKLLGGPGCWRLVEPGAAPERYPP